MLTLANLVSAGVAACKLIFFGTLRLTTAKSWGVAAKALTTTLNEHVLVLPAASS